MTDTETATPRRVIVLDTETTGLDPHDDLPLEVAWEDYATGESGCFVPRHDVEHVLFSANPQALEINGYRDRIMDRPQDFDGTEVVRLYQALEGATLVGSAPALDQAMLEHLFNDYDVGTSPRPWHHRVVDLGSYAAGVLRLPLEDVQGLWWLSGHLGVARPDHGAAQDVRATIECLRALEAIEHAGPARKAITVARRLLNTHTTERKNGPLVSRLSSPEFSARTNELAAIERELG